MQKLPNDRLFQRHSKEQIINWVNTLRHSYFIRAWGGHANDEDSFRLALTFTSQEDLQHIINTLSIPQQLGSVNIHDIPCHCEAHQGDLAFYFSGTAKPYQVTEADFNNCRKFEALIELKELTPKVSTKFESLSTCISRSSYPELFTSAK
jgi:hypothetical protein